MSHRKPLGLCSKGFAIASELIMKLAETVKLRLMKLILVSM
jgi:hypothetical protein